MIEQYFGQTKIHAGNKGFAIAAVQCCSDTFVPIGSSVLRTKFSAKTPRHRTITKHYMPIVERHQMKKQIEVD